MSKLLLNQQIWLFVQYNKMFNETSTVLVALSGGPDSVALVLLLKEIQELYCNQFKIHLAHLNHLLRGKESENDEEFVHNFAAQNNLPLTIDRLAVAEIAKGANLEATARELRYQFLQKTAQSIGTSIIATAHNLNDQAETFLMRLIRGSGVSGLSGIKPILKVNYFKSNLSYPTVNLIRPLLSTSRSEIEKYLLEKKQMACIDSSNFSTKLTRNKIRLEILPKLLEINPQAISAIARTSEQLRAWQELLNNKTNNLIIDKNNAENKEVNEIRLNVKELSDLPSILRQQKIRDAIEQLQGSLKRLTSTHIAAVDSLLSANKSGKKIELPNKLLALREFNQLVFKYKDESDVTKQEKFTVDLLLGQSFENKIFTISYENYVDDPNRINNFSKDYFALVDLEAKGNKLKVRFRHPGDSYQVVNHKGVEKVKDLMLEKRIALSQRAFWPLVTSVEDEIIWSPRLGLATKFAANSKTRHFAIIIAK
ncbi:MAG: tRNA lysidine(34) synthetase TilS [Blastocatellia bacterium]|nr:tRNA lysidine(34) synthetase TilS [Blastocatellia bacterium]